MNGLRKRGAFIVFEGCDRSGKTTQCRLLVDHLLNSGHTIKHISFPDRSTESGKDIDAYLRKEIDLPHEEIHLLFTRNRREWAGKMRELLMDGTTLIVDRYSFSGVAFSTAKGLDLEWCKTSEKGLPRPDAVFFLQINPTMLESRGGFGDERHETTDFQEKVHEIYKQLKDDSWIYVDACREREVILKEISDYALKIITNSQYKELKELW